MRITKGEHACVLLGNDVGTLVIDPGSFSARLTEVSDVVGVVVTHEHADHWTPEHLADLRARFPDAPVLGPAGTAAAVGDVVEVDVVAPGDVREVGGFALSFHGGTHAEIHRSLPRPDNVGVLVDGRLFHPGDSLELPEVDVEILAAPAGAPWLKIGEAIDFVTAIAPAHTFAIHEAVLSEAGLQISTARIRAAVEAVGGQHHVLRPGDTIEL